MQWDREKIQIAEGETPFSPVPCFVGIQLDLLRFAK